MHAYIYIYGTFEHKVEVTVWFLRKIIITIAYVV